jgi:hypothetical protein
MCERLFDLLEWGFSEFEILVVIKFKTNGTILLQQQCFDENQIVIGMDKHMKFERTENQFLVGHQIFVFELKEKRSLLFEMKNIEYR